MSDSKQKQKALARPTTRGELRDRLERGEICEVAGHVAEMTETMLRGWLDFGVFTTYPSDNDGWTVFDPGLPRSAVPAQENSTPDGLHIKYCITKADGRPVDDQGEYFVLKLNSEDRTHREACLSAARAYAIIIHATRPKLASDLLQRCAAIDAGQVLVDRAWHERGR